MIRRIKKGDIPECVRVIREAFLTVAKQFGYTPDTSPGFTGFSVSEERLLGQFDREHRPMFAYFDGDRIVGYYSLTLMDGGECELANLAVLPSHRHRGIGQKLLFHSFDEAKKRGRIKMKVCIVEENTVLRRWYESYGFVHTGTEKLDIYAFLCGYLEKALD